MTTPARLELQGITKQYPGVLANDRVSLTVQPGEIHAVLGENGAGKSTLMKIIYGAVQPDAGEMRFDGQRMRIHSPQQARQLGVAMMFQHFSLFDSLTVAENVWLGLDKAMPLAQVQRRIGEVAAAYGLPLDARRPVHSLSVGEMQRVEIIRCSIKCGLVSNRSFFPCSKTKMPSDFNKQCSKMRSGMAGSAFRV